MAEAPQFNVSQRQRAILQRLTAAQKTPQQLVERARIVLMSAEGMSNVDQAEFLNVDRQRVRRWRRRWAAQVEALEAAEAKEPTEKELEERVRDVLADAYRCGAPQRFSAEQVAQLFALACESPTDSGLPISHWTPADLRRELIKRSIFEEISPRSVDRFLKGGRYSPAQSGVLDAAKRGRSGAFSATSAAGVRHLRSGR